MAEPVEASSSDDSASGSATVALPARIPWARALVGAGGLAALVPGFPAALALAVGAALGLTAGDPLEARTRPLAKKLLPLSVVGLGGAMDLRAVARAGVHGFGMTVVTIGACLALGVVVSRLLRVPRAVGSLITVGTAICGGSAIAAAAPVVGAEGRETSVALGTVFLLNALALLLFPPAGRLVGLDPGAFGLWAALAIHDTSSVVGAALHFGPRALEIATTVKLARALWIVPVTLLLGVVLRRIDGGGARRGAARPPWFILGFVAVAAAATFVPGLRAAGTALAFVATRTLVLTLFLVGLGLSREGLRAVGWRPLALGAALWVVMASTTLAAIHAGLLVP